MKECLLLVLLLVNEAQRKCLCCVSWLVGFSYACVIAQVCYVVACLSSCLRMDSLAQMLTLSNIHAASKVLLVESCQGLVAGSILDRLGGKNLTL